MSNDTTKTTLNIAAWRLTNTAFRSRPHEYHSTRMAAENRQSSFNMSCDDGGLHNLTALVTLADAEAAIAKRDARIAELEAAATAAPQEPVAEVLWFDPALTHSEPKGAHKIIDAGMAWMESAPIGTKLYAAPVAAATAAQCWACPDCHIPEGCVIGQCTIGCKPPAKEAAATAAQPLTDERIKDLYVANHWYGMGEFTWGACAVVVRAIERELAAATAAQPTIPADVLEQALTDPENQPSQWDTVPMAQAGCDDAQECDALRLRMADLLNRTANAIRGEPVDGVRWSWADLPERAQAAMNALQGAMELAAATAAQPAQQFRLLSTGTVIQHGDEYLTEDAATWAPVTPLFVGMSWQSSFVPVRRKHERFAPAAGATGASNG